MTENTSLESFNEELEENHFQGQWKAIKQEGNGVTLSPHVWKWNDIYQALTEAKDVVSLEEQPQGARRSIGLRNPAYSSGNQTSRTINVGVQMVQPGEIARAHRHSITAFRFVIDGAEDAYTNVDGEQFPMKSGDLILTPRMSWHDHGNFSDEPIIWLDGLDVPLIKSLNAADFENFQNDRQAQEKPTGYNRNRYGNLRPATDGNLQDDKSDIPAFRYVWNDTYEALMSAVERNEHFDPYNGTRLKYVNPKTGQGPTLKTLSMYIQHCPEDETAEHRHNTTEIYHVVQGSGQTQINGDIFEWEAGDCFIVPPDNWHSHMATEPETILFAVSDRPVFESFDLLQEESREHVPEAEEVTSPISEQV